MRTATPCRPVRATLAVLFATTCFAAAAHAAEPAAPPRLDPFTPRTIRLAQPAQARWVYAVHPLTEGEYVYFTDESYRHEIPLDRYLAIHDDVRYRLSYRAGIDFDFAYVVTALSLDRDADLSGNPKCVFVISDLKPGIADNHVTNLGGASCTLQIDGKGELVLLLDRAGDAGARRQ